MLAEAYQPGTPLKFLGYTEDVPESEQVLDAYDFVTVEEQQADQKPDEILVRSRSGQRTVVLVSEVKTLNKKELKKYETVTKAESKPRSAKVKVLTEGSTNAEALVKADPSQISDLAFLPTADLPQIKKILEIENEAEQAEALLSGAKNTQKEFRKNVFALGGLLAHIRRTRAFANITDAEGVPLYAGRDGFHAYVADHFDFEGRYADHLIRGYVVWTPHIVSGQFTEEDIANIESSKLRRITAFAKHTEDPDKLKLLTEAAAPGGKTVQELDQWLHNEYVKIDPEAKAKLRTDAGTKKRYTSFVFKLLEGDDADRIVALLERVMKANELTTPEQALVQIATDYEYLIENQTRSLEEMIQWFESATGTSIQVINKD